MSSPEEKCNCCRLFLQFIKFYWKNIVLVTWPILCTLIIFLTDEPWDSEDGRKFRLLYCITVMVVFWVFEIIPLPLTALLPVVLFPLFRVMCSEVTTQCYSTQITFIFLGSFCATLAIEYSNLHVRIALLMVKIVGANPRRLQFGITTVAFFLSCWVINVPCLAMLCPIVKSILEKLESNGIGQQYKPNGETSEDGRPRPSNMAVAFYAGVGFSVALGGAAVIVGNALNLIMKVLIEKIFSTSDIITFLPWFLFFGPVHLFITFVMNILLQVLYMGLFRRNVDGMVLKEAKIKLPAAYEAMMEEYNNLGKLSWYEWWVIVIYVYLIIAWFLRKPGFFPGWSDFIAPSWDRSIHDACVPAMLAFIVLFILPLKNTFLYACSKYPDRRPKSSSISMITWHQFRSRVPWQMFFIFGGSMSIAIAARGDQTDLAKFVGSLMHGFLKNLSPHIVMLLIVLICTILTEFYSSNTILSILVPGVAHVAVSLRINPVYLCLPGFAACVYAFCIPISNPANIYMASFANISTFTMIKTGILIKILACSVTCLMFPTYGRLFWNYSDFPPWANITKSTFTTKPKTRSISSLNEFLYHDL